MAAPVSQDSKGVDAFLASCAESGDAAYRAAKTILERLQDPDSRAEARRLLGAVRLRFADPAAEQECISTFHFRIHDVIFNPNLQGPISYLSRRPIITIGCFADWATFGEILPSHPVTSFGNSMTILELLHIRAGC
jgi:methionine S-methyltransferase